MTRPPAVILAGGLSRRMGADKATVQLGGQSLLDHVIARLAPQVPQVAVNAPAPLADLPHVPDPVAGRLGPLAGVLGAMLWARGLGYDRVLTAPVDTPFLPRDLVARLAAHDAMVIARSERAHPVIGLWPVSLAEALRQQIDAGARRIGLFAAEAAQVAWDTRPDPFFNVNTPEDLRQAHARL